ncbi:MAG: hypothetical protein GY835_19625 [bacterium]|nr:hypothetical protein [bacterium]
MSIIRIASHELGTYDGSVLEPLIDKMVAYARRRTDGEQTRTEVKNQYGTYIKIDKDPGGTAETQTYVTGEDERFHTRVDQGMIATVSIGFLQKIANARATLFTEQGQRFALNHPTDKDPSEALELLEEMREKSGFESAISKANRLAVQCGSAGLLHTYSADGPALQILAPSDVRAYHNEFVFEGTDLEGKPKRRAAHKDSIDDAYCLIIRLAQIDAVTWSYLAIFGRSDLYPLGRHVIFQATEEVTEVPREDENNLEMEDYKIDGVICNPLSHFIHHNPDVDFKVPEYPLVVFDGGVTESATEIMPVSFSLYENSLTFDVSASHTHGTSQDAARGTTKFTRTAEAQGKKLPRKMTGPVDLPVGMDMDHVSHDSAASKDAMDVLKDDMIQTAASFSVPDYMVVTEDHTLDASSGIALSVKTRPLKKAREADVKENKPNVQRLFEIEKTYIQMYAEDSRAQSLFECTQDWDAGELKMPENKKEEAERIKMLGEIGVLDEIAKIREYYKCASDDEAIEIYEKMRDRADEFPPLNKPDEPEPPKKQVGLLRKANVKI